MSFVYDKKGCRIDDKNSQIYYHGSPYKIDKLLKLGEQPMVSILG